MKLPELSADELQRRLAAEFREAFHSDSALEIREVWHGGASVRLAFREASVGPGGRISGPTLMMLADVAMYVGLLASIGWVPFAVTTSLNINFLHKPARAPLLAECRLIKLGRRLAVGHIGLRSEGADDLSRTPPRPIPFRRRTRRLNIGNKLPNFQVSVFTRLSSFGAR